MYDIFFMAFDERDRAWLSFKNLYPNALRLDLTDDLVSTAKMASQLALTQMFWLVHRDLMKNEYDPNFGYKPPTWDLIRAQCWSGKDGNPIAWLIPSQPTPDADFISSAKRMISWYHVTGPYDMFFISYGEPNADGNYAALHMRFPRLQRVDGIKGIHNAHRRCAELSHTAMFWTIDADTVVDDDFMFDHVPPICDMPYPHVWFARNPINGLEYGWGAIKLWPTASVLRFDGNYLDYTTTVGGLKIMSNAVATSSFNTDALSSWRSGFREAVKLSRNVHEGDHGESLERLMAWANAIESNAPYADDCTRGVREGISYFIDCQHDRSLLARINDWNWLHEMHAIGGQPFGGQDRISASDLVASLGGIAHA